MRILIFSDIHSNADNILSVIKNNTFDKILFAGDIFGYFIGSPKIVDFFLNNNIEFILGNHDLYFLRKLNNELFRKYLGKYEKLMISHIDYQKKYGAIEETIINIMNEDVLKFYTSDLIKNMQLDMLKFIICHGSPYNPFDEYLYPDSDKFDRIFTDFDFDILICGHTHKQFVIKRGERYILNPGSCTLPRGNNKPSYLIINTNPIEISVIENRQKINYILESKSKVKLI
jgi:putative phosphoesterase